MNGGQRQTLNRRRAKGGGANCQCVGVNAWVDPRPELNGQVVDVLLYETQVEEGEVRVERLDQKKLNHQRVVVLHLPSMILPPRRSVVQVEFERNILETNFQLNPSVVSTGQR